MPSRPLIALIVLFWLATLGWFGYREIWPKFRSGEAPPFVIELADEATSQLPDEKLRPADALWSIRRSEKEGTESKIGGIETRLRYFKEDDTFELQNRVIELKLKVVEGLPPIEIPEMINSYRISRAGQLRGIVTKGKMKIGLLFSAEAEFHADVRGDKLERKGSIHVPRLSMFGKKPEVGGASKDNSGIELHLEPIDAPKGIFLNPLHPVPRVKYLKPGRQWQMPVFNPLADAVKPMLNQIQQQNLPGSKPIDFNVPVGAKMLSAEVLTETARIPWNKIEYECHIIEFRSENESYRTYVRKSDGQVLRQESQALGERFIIQRE